MTGRSSEYRGGWADLDTKVRITGVHEAHSNKTRTLPIILYRVAHPVDFRTEDTELGEDEFFFIVDVFLGDGEFEKLMACVQKLLTIAEGPVECLVPPGGFSSGGGAHEAIICLVKAFLIWPDSLPHLCRGA